MTADAAQPKPLLDDETRAFLSERFTAMKGDVELHSFIAPQAQPPAAPPPSPEAAKAAGEKLLFEHFTVAFCRALAECSSRIRHVEHQGLYVPPKTPGKDDLPEEVSLFPSVIIRAAGKDRPLLRITGAPLGEEARVLVQAILLAGSGASGLSDPSKEALAALDGPRHIRVFTSPGCPYCPAQVFNAFKTATERPDLITAECIVTEEFPDMARKYGVGSVPHTQFSEDYASVGQMTETMFIGELTGTTRTGTSGKPSESVAAQWADSLNLSAAASSFSAGGPRNAEIPEGDLDLVILGGGPAGLSAAIYAARAGLKTVLLDRGPLGGQVLLTPVVENYPSHASISGVHLAEIMASHARQYVPLLENTEILDISRDETGLTVRTPTRAYRTKTLLFATGATRRNLDVPGEDRLYGKGLVHCASCDGFLFKGRSVAVVGGGNTALTDALHLKNLGVSVTIVHRRNSFRAEEALQKAVEREGIAIVWNSVPLEVIGKNAVEGLRLKNLANGEESVLPVNGVFVAVGQKPNSELAATLGVALELSGTIRIDASCRTSTPGIYAAGDVCGGPQQIVTAVSAGAVAAMSVFSDLHQK